MRLVLGSQSPRRAKVIGRIVPAGMTVQIVDANLDERDPKYHRPPEPSLAAIAGLTLRLARDKNDAVRKRLGTDDSVVVTADCIAYCDGELREKPVDAAELRRFLESYQEHAVTAVASIWVHNTRTGWTGSATDVASVSFHPFRDRIDAIVADPLFYGSAGGFLMEHPLMADRVRLVTGDCETIHGMSGTLAGMLIRDALAS